MRLTVVVSAVVLFIAAGAAAPLHAQVQLEVTPFFASYFATNYTSYTSENENERQEAGPGVGLDVKYHFTRLIGMQLQATYVRSGIIPRQPLSAGTLSILNPLPGALTFVSARATVQPRRSNYFLAAGLGAVRRSGEAWELAAFDDLTDVMGSVGFGIRARITPEREFSIGVDLNLYRTNPDGSAPYYGNRLQRDVLVSIGVPFALIER